MDVNRLEQQMRFLVEVDKMKSVYRRTILIDKTRRESDAEHSWHFALMAMLLAEKRTRKRSTARASSAWRWCTI